MERIELKCQNCGSTLNKIETQKDTYICLHCGHKEIIKNENTKTNFYINQTVTKNIYGTEKPSEEDYYKLLQNAEKYFSIEDYKKAISLTNQAKKIDEGNYLAWWISTKAKLNYNIKNKEDDKIVIYYSTKNIEQDYKKAYNFAEDAIKKQISEEFEPLFKEYCSLLESNENTQDNNVQPMSLDKFIVVIKILTVLHFVFGLIISILVVKFSEIENDAIFACPIMFTIIGILWIAVINHFKETKRIVDFIKTKNKVSIEDIYNYCQKKYRNIEYSKLDKSDKKQFTKKIQSIIDVKYLDGYKIENEYIIKINNTSK